MKDSDEVFPARIEIDSKELDRRGVPILEFNEKLFKEVIGQKLFDADVPPFARRGQIARIDDFLFEAAMRSADSDGSPPAFELG